MFYADVVDGIAKLMIKKCREYQALRTYTQWDSPPLIVVKETTMTDELTAEHTDWKTTPSSMLILTPEQRELLWEVLNEMRDQLLRIGDGDAVPHSFGRALDILNSKTPAIALSQSEITRQQIEFQWRQLRLSEQMDVAIKIGCCPDEATGKNFATRA